MNKETIKRVISSIILLPLAYYSITQGFLMKSFLNHTNYSISLLKILILAISLSTVSQIGDIIVSYFKRLSKIKHTGNIIPGHGGLLDRIDGMIFAFPFFFFLKLMGFVN